MPVLEAMAAGCPVIASDIGVHHEVANGAAIFVDPNEADAFVVEFEKLFNDEQLRQSWSERGRARAERFSWRECARQTAAVYARARVS